MKLRTLKYLILLEGVITLYACNKEKVVEPFDSAKLVGTIYSNSDNRVEFISKDSLIYTNTVITEFDISYRAKYTLDGENLSFKGKDTVRVDLESNLVKEWFITYYYSDSFNGHFKNAQELNVNLWYGYEGFDSQTPRFPIATSNTTADIILIKEKN